MLELILKTYLIAAFILLFILFLVNAVIAVIGIFASIRLFKFLQKNYHDIWVHITTVPIICPTGGGSNPTRVLKLLLSPPDKLKADPEFQRIQKPNLYAYIGMDIVSFFMAIIGFSVIIIALIWRL